MTKMTTGRPGWMSVAFDETTSEKMSPAKMSMRPGASRSAQSLPEAAPNPGLPRACAIAAEHDRDEQHHGRRR